MVKTLMTLSSPIISANLCKVVLSGTLETSSPRPPPLVREDEPVLMLPEEPHQVEDVVHAEQVHQQGGPED